MKKKIYSYYLYILHVLVFVSCYLNSAKICAYLIKLSLFKQKSLNKKIYNKKIRNSKKLFLKELNFENQYKKLALYI